MNKNLHKDRENGLFSHVNGNFISNITSISYKLLFLGHRSLIKNKTQTAVINIVNKRILINLTFRMLDNIHFQK